MLLSTQQRDTAYLIVGDEATTYCGYGVTRNRSRWRTDQAILSFESWVSGNPHKKPTVSQLKAIAKAKWKAGEQDTTNGEEIYGSIILTFILMQLIGVAIKLLIEWLWNRWQKTTEQ